MIILPGMEITWESIGSMSECPKCGGSDIAMILYGLPSQELSVAPPNKLIKLCPIDFPGIKPKLLVSEGDSVKRGEPLYFDKKNLMQILYQVKQPHHD